MTKKEIVDDLNQANTTVVFALLSKVFPFLNIPVLSFIVRHYIAKWLRPANDEGVVFVSFKVIDWAEASGAENFLNHLKRLANALSKEGISEDLPSASDAFDDAFHDAIDKLR